jgi:hypothetical protein
MPEQASIQNRNFSAVTNNDLLEEIRSTHSHMQLLARLMDKAEAPTPEKSPIDEFAFVDEFQDVPNDKIVTLQCGAVDPVLITNIIYSMPSTATGTLSIGDRNIPVSASVNLVTAMNSIAMIVYQNETFTLTSSVTGRLYLEVMGHVLTGDRWSKV